MSDFSEQVIKGYEMRERIGGGGFGDVYRAYQPLLKREVAIKIIRSEYANHPDFIRRFETEAQMVARLEHLRIIPLHDYWRDPTGAYLVMRLLRGGNLRALIQNEGALPPAQVLKVMQHVTEALAEAHRNGVIHRDIKPDNIMLDEEGNAYVGDFGIAKDLSTGSGTQSQLVMGSPDYLSPEQIEGGHIGPYTDVYTLGIVIFELLTGQKPFGDDSATTVLNKHLYDPVPSIRTVRPELPLEIDRVIQHATDKSQQARYPDVMTLMDELRRALTPLVRDARRSYAQTDGETTAILTREARNPYKGLDAFQQPDAADFFGREELVKLLVHRLNDTDSGGRFLAVIGPSGCGKTSLVKAGVIPALRKGALPGSENWFIIELEPHNRPLEQLEIALLRVAVNPPPTLLQQLEEDTRGLLRAVKRILPDEHSQLLLVIDHFEEVFTHVEEEPERIHFLDSLLEAVSDPNSHLRVLITLRADFYDRPLLYSNFGYLFRRRNEVVMPLTPDELERVIVEPAVRSGLMLEAGLVQAIVSDVRDQPSALPLLQYALTELYERRRGNMLTLEAYRASGRATGALALRAEQTYTDLDAEGQEAARQLFLRLVVPGEGVEDTRRRVTQAEIASITGNEQVMNRVIDTFAKHRLLAFDRDPITRLPTIEVAHEALVRSWSRLWGWLDTSREELRMQRRLMAHAEEWRSAGRDPGYLLPRGHLLDEFEQWVATTHIALTQDELTFLEASRQKKSKEEAEDQIRLQHEREQDRVAKQRLQTLMAVMVIAAIIGVGLSIFAFDRARQADDSKQDAQTQAADAAEARGTALFEGDNARTAAANAITAQANSDTKEHEANTQAANATIAQGQAQSAAHQAQTQAANATAAQGQALVQADYANTQAALAAAAQGQALTEAANANLQATQAAVAQEEALEGQATAVAAQSTAEKSLQQGRSLALFGGAEQALKEQQPDVALALALAANQVDNPPPLARQALFDAVSASWIRNRWVEHRDWVWSVAFSPDGKQAVSASQDKRLILWDVATGKVIHILEGHTAPVHSVVFSPDGSLILSASEDKTLILWDAITGTPLHTLYGHQDQVRDVAISPDGTTAISASFDKTLILWDLATGSPIRTFTGHTGQVLTVAFSPDGKTAVSGSNDNTLIIWDVSTGTPLHTLSGHTNEVWDAAFSPDGTRIVSASFDKTLILWDAATGKRLRTITGLTSEPLSVTFHPNGKLILVGSNDNSLSLWDITRGDRLRVFQGHSGSVTSAVFSPDGRSALSGSTDKSLILWDMTADDVLFTFTGHTNWVKSVAFSPDGRSALSASDDGTLILWDIGGRRILRTFQQSGSVGMNTVAFSPDGRTALSGTRDNRVLLWDVASGNLLREFKGHTGEVNSVAFSPDGTQALSGSNDNTVILWDVASGTALRTFQNHQGPVTAVAFSPDGKKALSGSSDLRLILWDVASGTAEHEYTGHKSPILAIAFSPDGQHILSGSSSSELLLWDVATGTSQALRGHTGGVETLAFSPDGKTALSGSFDNTLILWDITTGDPLRRFQWHSNAVYGVAFSPDGATALSASQDGRVILWQIAPYTEGVLTWAQRSRYIPPLTCDQRRLYDLQPPCDANNQPPPATALPPPSLPPDVAVAPTPLPLPTPAPSAAILNQLAQAGISSGYLAEQQDRAVIDLTGKDNQVGNWWIGGEEHNLVMGATIQWGAGAPNDECGFIFRHQDWGNFYEIVINRQGDLVLGSKIDNQWQDSTYADGYAIKVDSGAANDLMLVASGDTFSVYLNGVYAAQFHDSALATGRTSLQAATYADSDQSGCTFVAPWVWDLGDTAPVIAAPPPPPAIVQALSTVNLAPDSGTVAGRINNTVLDLTGKDNQFAVKEFGGTYTNFAAATTIQWGPGDVSDYCGIQFRRTGNDQLYSLEINRKGELGFRARNGNAFAGYTYGNGALVKTGTADTNQILLVAVRSTFSVYLNGVYAGQFQDSSLASGSIALQAGTFASSDASNCTFTDAWVWALNADVQPTIAPPSPTPAPVLPSPTVIPTVAASTQYPDVDAGLALVGVSPNTGHLDNHNPLLVIDFAQRPGNFIALEPQVMFGDLVVSTTFTHDSGAPTDQCGIILRAQGGNYYLITISQEGKLRFRLVANSAAAGVAEGDGSAIQIGTNASNTLTVLATGNTFKVYVNGQFAGEFQDASYTSGYAGIVMTSETSNSTSKCTFTNTWMWVLN